MSNKPLHCLHEFGSGGPPQDTPKAGATENWSDKKSDTLFINGDMLVMGHDKAERKGKSEKTPRKTAAGIPVSNMHNRFIQQGDRKGDFFFIFKGKYSAKAASNGARP